MAVPGEPEETPDAQRAYMHIYFPQYFAQCVYSFHLFVRVLRDGRGDTNRRAKVCVIDIILRSIERRFIYYRT